MYKAVLVILVVLVSCGISNAASMQVDTVYGTTITMEFGDTVSINPQEIKGDLIIECSYKNHPGERSITNISSAFMPKHTFSIYCGERQDYIVISLIKGSGK